MSQSIAPSPASESIVMEFRCHRCWRPNYVATDSEGQKTPCQHCATELVVPAPTPERIQRAQAAITEAANAEAAAAAKPAVDKKKKQSDAELAAKVRKEMYTPLKEMDFLGYPDASRVSRLVANIIDGFFFLLTVVGGVMLLFSAVKLEIIADISPTESMPAAHMAILYGPIALGVLLQWTLMTMRGQSIGKFVCFIRVIDCGGKIPGFVRGVMLRSWLTFLLSMIPLYSLLDVLPIFTYSRRCIHDYLAGTRVIQA